MNAPDAAGLPPTFLERLARLTPPERLPGVLAAFHEPPVTAFRVNTLRASAEAVAAELGAAGLALHAAPWKPGAFWVAPEARAALLASAPYARAEIYVQNLSSMIPPAALGARPGERVLDLAAAPGGKTLQIACDMQNTGELAAVEAVRGRFFRLRSNLEAHGATVARAFLKNGEDVWRHRPEHFDRVLLDAPCSTEGRFRADDPETAAYWSPRKIAEMARKQQRLLYAAVQCLRPGGVLVYATCTMAPEENEQTIDRLLRRFGDALEATPLGLEPPGAIPALAAWEGQAFRDDLRHARRVLPSRLMEAFFVCRLVKRAGTLHIGRRRAAP